MRVFRYETGGSIVRYYFVSDGHFLAIDNHFKKDLCSLAVGCTAMEVGGAVRGMDLSPLELLDCVGTSILTQMYQIMKAQK